MQKITEKTLLPISLLTVIAGAIFWLSALYVRQESSAKDLAELKQTVNTKDNRTQELLLDILQRVSRIERAVEEKH